jgi:predicted ATPase/DNA-binding CsgD family transcriptional regulator
MPQIESPASTAHASPGAPLPRPLSSLIAREQDVAAVASLLRDPSVRLLTLTGPGGVGKTRLAIASVASVAHDFPDGVAYVDLSPVSDPELVLDTIAVGFGLRDIGSTGALHERLMAAIGERRLLLVIDNFEQVVVAAPRLLALLERCPGLTIIVTSRIRLRISGERELSVAPLPLHDSATTETTPESGAVQLFVERARAIVPDFAPDAAATGTIAEIVRRLDGLPLAIELAAARSKALPPAELLKRMEHRLPLLSGGARDLPLRQQTMRDTIGWSYDLLDDADQALFRRLGVFAGGFSLEAAEAMSSEALDGITTLIEHSLLQQRTGPDGASRYSMLETVREFARVRLNESQERDSVQRRHAEIFLALAEASEPMLTGPDQVEWLDRLERDHDNLRTALHWALTHPEPRVAARLGGALWLFWRRRGYLGEGRSHLARILALPPMPETRWDRYSMLTGSGVLAIFQGEYDQAKRSCEEALTGWRQIDGQQGIGRSLLCLATVARHRDDYLAAETLGQQSLTAFREIDDRWGAGRVLGHLGMLAWVQGDHATGTRLYEEALANLRAVGDLPGMLEVLLELGKGACDDGDLDRATTLFEECLALSATIHELASRCAALTELGVVARLRGDHDRARDLLLQSVSLARGIGDRRQMAYLAAHLGDVDFDTGDVGEAATRYAEALGLFGSMGNRVGIAQCIEKIARCAEQHGNMAPAIRLLGSSAAMFDAIGATPPPDRDPATDAASLSTKISPSEFARAWEAGWALSPDAATAEAITLATELAQAARAVTTSEAISETKGQSPATALGLTAREIEVLALLGDGSSDREIADALSISERTAGNHVQHAMQKIGVSSRTAAAVYAVRHGLV